MSTRAEDCSNSSACRGDEHRGQSRTHTCAHANTHTHAHSEKRKPPCPLCRWGVGPPPSLSPAHTCPPHVTKCPPCPSFLGAGGHLLPMACAPLRSRVARPLSISGQGLPWTLAGLPGLATPLGAVGLDAGEGSLFLCLVFILEGGTPARSPLPTLRHGPHLKDTRADDPHFPRQTNQRQRRVQGPQATGRAAPCAPSGARPLPF